ncbi:MAG: SDR family NAD(P)-dependent oxidoreductase [Opitutales bacterium]|nr:SDR family NAD(P)-dependent oxidoreductase [Opitutales bacterium]MCH8539978.1 SDR family NAD(P)-dependent oxidoreductase [Opitutales bacterium]
MSFWKKFRTIVITGASSGIGAAFVPKLREKCPDAHIYGLSRSHPTEGEKLLYDPISVDLTNPADLERLEQDLPRIFAQGPVLLINNSGFGSYGPFPQPDLENHLNMMDLNVKAPVWLVGRALPWLRREGGAIINVASTAGFQPTPFLSTYGATKAFLLHWSMGLHHDLKKDGIRVLALCPGPTATDFFRRAGFEGKVVPDAFGQTSEQVVQAAMRALEKNRSLVVSGWKNKILVAVSSKLPKALGTALSARVLAKVRQ